MFQNVYSGKRVLITGHTGFKGSWLAFFLRKLGAEVCGLALPAEKESHWNLLNLPVRSEICDVRDPEKVRAVIGDFRPEIVFHLAAQPLVRRSYREPAETFATNVMGTIHVLEACRFVPSVRAAVVITSDKCYENRETLHPYTETDPMGGYDPYSASKGCAELAVSSYRRSFFHPGEYGKKHRLLLASARAGNVIGGGDWAEDRLVPDLMRAAAAGQAAEIRNPGAVRPWQHVLEPLSGYLALGQKLLQGETAFADAWNFGPSGKSALTVKEAAEFLTRSWDKVKVHFSHPENAPHEAGFLTLDCSKAEKLLHWHGTWNAEETFARTALWYRNLAEKQTINTEQDWTAYTESARKEGLAWTL